MKRLLVVLVATLCVSGIGVAHAQTPPPYGSTSYRHLGLYFNAALGFGYLKSTASQGGIDASVSGGSGVFSLALGGAVSENFILAGHVWDSVAFSPSVTLGPFSGTATNASSYVVGFGPSLVYYFMPSNLYIQVSPSITKLSSERGGQTYSTESGFGAWLGLGKEWWVGDHWGLGVAGHVVFSSNKDQGAGAPTWGSYGFGLQASLTYN